MENLERPFIIPYDASGSGLGAILAQVDEHNNEYVCEFASRLLHNAERHYSIKEKEWLSVIYIVFGYEIIFMTGQRKKFAKEIALFT